MIIEKENRDKKIEDKILEICRSIEENAIPKRKKADDDSEYDSESGSEDDDDNSDASDKQRDEMLDQVGAAQYLNKRSSDVFGEQKRSTLKMNSSKLNVA